jgi:hypothetical protein
MPRVIRDRKDWGRLFTFWKGVTYHPNEQYKPEDFQAISSHDAPELVKSYYGALLGSAEAVRSHAQAGAAVATGAAGSLLPPDCLAGVKMLMCSSRWSAASPSCCGLSLHTDS